MGATTATRARPNRTASYTSAVLLLVLVALPPERCPIPKAQVSSFDITDGSMIGMVSIPSVSAVMLGGEDTVIDVPHVTSLSAFDIDLTEVTVERYTRCVRAGTCAPPGCEQRGGDFPVDCVSALDGDAMCAFEGKRLPISDEWEYAARGTDGRSFPWGNHPMMTNDEDVIEPAGRRVFDVSPFGVRDLGANVGEWTATRMGNDPQLRLVNMRGGCNANDDGRGACDTHDMRSYDFADIPEDGKIHGVGFRCARTHREMR